MIESPIIYNCIKCTPGRCENTRYTSKYPIMTDNNIRNI